MAVLVLGMHRTGSSAITRFLNFLGCTLPHTLLDANPTNPAGHWESDAIRAFNDGMLAEAGSAWSDWLPMHADWAKSQTYQDNLPAAAKVLDAEFGDAALFVLKDPRICRLAGFWYEVLAQRNIETATLIPLRNPLEVAASLCKRDRMDPTIGQLLWLRHVLDAEFASRGRRRMFTHYEELLDNWSGLADRLGEGLEIDWPRSRAAFAADATAFLSHDLRHHVRQPADIIENAAYSRWLRETYAILLRWIAYGEDDEGRARLDAIRQAFNETGENFFPVVTALSTAHREIEDISRDRHSLALRVAELTQVTDDAHTEKFLAADRLDAANRRAEDLDRQLDLAFAQLRDAGDAQQQLHLSLETADRRSKLLDEELAAVRNRLAQANGALATTQTSLDDATRTVASLEAKLQSTREELSQTVLAHAKKDDLLTASGDRIAALDADLDQARHQMKEADLRLDSLCLRITQADAEIVRWQTTTKQLNVERQMDHQEMEGLRASLKLKSNDLKMQRHRHEQEIAALHGETQASVARNVELSILHVQAMERADSLSGQLQEARAYAVLQNDHVHFLRETLRILAAPGRWWLRLVPAGWAKAIKDKTLQREGLFDADSYRNHYPDVADAGGDPLLHYVSHGLEEGRLRT
ncbi:hypothetical protein EWE75_20595 [Sphingomonas populi]|uniref:Sulfotransferase family protein n=1 Tax=Sphingomonas populi TaxID=2484750 RepID=A0A4Q6XLB3_9SPHN|nr:hypothetical protein [Sphingomonas populi]RZF60900.1 hypothetical protein EWE75_20595 [Sphingomonas populi]